QVPLDGARLAGENGVGQRVGGGKARGVFVNVKRRVEMGNPGPLDVDLRVHGHFRAVVVQVQAAVHLAQAVGGQRAAFLHVLVGHLFELGEQRLPEDGRAELLQVVVENVQPAL